MSECDTSKALYSIAVYEDCARIKGWLTSDILNLLIKLCKKEGFTHLIPSENPNEFKLVRKNEPT